MRLSHPRIWAALCLVLTLILTACGSKPAPEPAPAPTTGDSSTQTDAAAPAPADQSSAEAPQDTIKIKVAYSAISSGFAPLWLAEGEGLFQKHGLDVELVYLEGGSKSVQGLLSDEVQIAISSADSVIKSGLKGADVRILAGTFDRYFFQIFSRPEITKPEDLKGKVVAASGAGASSDSAARAALATVGLKEGDYQVTYVGSTSARLAALEQGSVDAAVISPPNGLKAKKAGMNQLFNLIEMDIPGGYLTTNARQSWMDQNHEAVIRFLKGYLEGIALAKKDRELAKKYIAQYTETEEADLLEESYLLAVPLMKDVPAPPVEVVEYILGELKDEEPKAQEAKPEDFIAPQFIKELEESGFTDQFKL